MKKPQMPTVFVSSDYRYMSDTCEPLKGGIRSKTLTWTGFKRGLYPGDDLQSKELEGLRLLAYWDTPKTQSWGLPFHRNEGLEIGFVERGSVDFSTDKKGRRFSSISPQSITVTKPWQEHSIGNPNLTVSKMYFVIIDFGVRRPNQDWKWPSWIILGEREKAEFTAFMKNLSNCVFNSTPEIKSAFAKLGGILSDWSENDFSKIAVNINSILIELLDVFRGNKSAASGISPNENVVRCFLDQLPSYCGEPWTLENMAADCGLKPTRFSYYCRLLTNSTPIEILANARLERAREILEKVGDELSITDVAFECGFSSSQYFSTKFREKYGKSPREFRDSLTQ